MKLKIALAAAALLALPALGLAEDSAGARDSKMSRDSGMELVELIERFAKRTGKKFVLDPRVRGIVITAGIDTGQLTYEQLLAILDVNAFVAFELNGLITVVPDAGGRQLPTPVYTDLNFKALDHELVTLALELRNACSAHLVPILRPLMPQAAHMAASLQGNLLVLTDDAANIRRVAQLAERMDRAAPSGQKCPAEMPGPPKRD